MDSPSPNEKFGLVLNYANKYPEREVSVNELTGYLKLTHPDIFSIGEIRNVLNKLTAERHMSTLDSRFYKITLEGIVFLENGGYNAKNKENFIKRQYLKVARRSDEPNGSLLPWFMALLALAIIIIFLKFGFDHWNWQVPF